MLKHEILIWFPIEPFEFIQPCAPRPQKSWPTLKFAVEVESLSEVDMDWMHKYEARYSCIHPVASTAALTIYWTFKCLFFIRLNYLLSVYVAAICCIMYFEAFQEIETDSLKKS